MGVMLARCRCWHWRRAARRATCLHRCRRKNWEFVDKYCGSCHNSTDWAGGVAFDVMEKHDPSAPKARCGKKWCASCAAR